jgi:hypothetical protein
MKGVLFKRIAVLWVILPVCSHADSAGNQFFEKQVRPILIQRCNECHGEKKQKGGLRTDSLAHLKSGGDTGPALVPGAPEKSPLIEAVRYGNEDFKMPPKEKLSAGEIAVLEQWVKMGAPWPETEGKAEVVMEGGFTEEQRKYWCFQPLRVVAPPEARGGWDRNEIDRFITTKHGEHGLEPAPEAGRAELVRRLYFDLHGLPPGVEEIRTFEQDPAADAYERLVDRLLESPRYGERWAQHWLDLVRYAESDGYNEDAYRPAAWPYRDWVIQSLNSDKPYDQFVREQLAGDEIAPEDPKVLIATAYLRHPVYEWNQRDARSQWDLILTDITDTTGEVFLGLSFGCARCHNHKFDPILQKDYYRLRAFFAAVHWRDDMVLATPDEKKAFGEKIAVWENTTRGVREKMGAITGKPVESAGSKALAMFSEDLQEIVRKDPAGRDSLETQLAGLCRRQMDRAKRNYDPLKSLKDPVELEAYKALAEELKSFDALKPAPLPEAFVATDTGRNAAAVSYKTRKGKLEVMPGFLSILDPGEPSIAPLTESTGRRLALANWITRPDNPLSTRVIVNRVWQYHFGKGIVASTSDFGRLGDPPTHPELLDWLARTFVEDGWSLKKLHRRILLSATYRQTARRQPDAGVLKVDPANRYLWRFSPRRLDAEQIRDALLAASGELDLSVGGPPAEGTSVRRSIYTRKKRNTQTEVLQRLDAPSGFASTADRQSTTTPIQALLFLNGDWPLERARSLATRAGTVEDAWLCVLGRRPTEQEMQTATRFLRKQAGGSGVVEPTNPKAGAVEEVFRENSGHERLVWNSAEREGESFTVQAVFSLESIDKNASVRTLVSRWNLGKESVEDFGWSVGVTGVKSRYTPQTLIVQLVGEDENSNITYEVVPSTIPIELGHRYAVAVSISPQERQVRFRVRDLSRPESLPREVVVSHTVRQRLLAGASPLVIGGLPQRMPSHQWDGVIQAVRISDAESPEIPLEAPLKNTGLEWFPGKTGPTFEWKGGGDAVARTGKPSNEAMEDLCQILLNANEFFYLH